MCYTRTFQGKKLPLVREIDYYLFQFESALCFFLSTLLLIFLPKYSGNKSNKTFSQTNAIGLI